MPPRTVSLVLALALAGCPFTTNGVPDLPPRDSRPVTPVDPPPLTTSQPVTGGPPPAGRLEADDRLMVGDVLQLTVLGQPALTVERTRVAHDGTVFVPFVGRIGAGGRTATEVARSVEEGLFRGEYLLGPQVSVELLEARPRRAYVLGRVVAPGAQTLPREQTLTLSQVVALAGGFNLRQDIEPAADVTAVQLHREVDGAKRIYVIDFQDLVERGRTQVDVPIRDGDVIYVPAQPQVTVLGSVRSPGRCPLPVQGTLGIDDALALAGGFTENADRRRVQLVRRGEGGLRSYAVPPERAARARWVVAPDDVLVVSYSAENQVYVAGSVQRPGAYPIGGGMTLVNAIIVAGWTTRYGSLRSVLLRRPNAATDRTVVVDVIDIIEGGNFDRDPQLEPGDVVIVPEGVF